MKKNRRNIISYSGRIHMNIGMIVFLVFFIYIVINLVLYAVRPRIQVYEVNSESSVMQDTTYTALILRDEHVVNAPASGYVNVYVREGTRASMGEYVCLLDSNGQYTQMLSKQTNTESTLTSAQLISLKNRLVTFSTAYDPARFQDVYSEKFGLQNQLLSFMSQDSLNEIAELGVDTQYLTLVPSEASGVVEYYTDGMETLTEENMTADSFRTSNAQRNSLTSGNMVSSGDPVFKTISSENWTVYLPLNTEDQAALTDQTSIRLFFTDINMELPAKFSLVTLSDGTVVGKCEIKDYMIQLADKRFTTVSIRRAGSTGSSITGLKIPRTAIVTEEFYVVPVSYAGYGDNDGAQGFYLQGEDGQVTFCSAEICGRNDDFYYIRSEEITEGSVLVKPEGGENGEPGENAPTYTVSAEATLQGVMNINKGYAQFRQITILDENSDYVIIRNGQPYGLTIYDHILLNGNMAEDGEIIY